MDKIIYPFFYCIYFDNDNIILLFLYKIIKYINMAKVIGLENLDVIGQYISDNNKVLSDKLDSDTRKYIDEKLDQASEYIANDYNKQYNDLLAELELLKSKGSDANNEAIKELELQLDNLEQNTKNMYSALDALDTELKRLGGDLNDGLKSIFSEGEINDLLDAALIDKTTITEDTVEAPNVYCRNLVSLIAKFGKISAAQIEAGDITGHTIASNTNIPGTETPLWKIDNYGEGHLASGNIKWDRDGNVEFGPGVSLSWNNIDGGNEVKNKLDKFEDDRKNLANSITTNRNEVNSLISDWGSDNLLSPAEIISLKRLADQIKSEYDNIIKNVNALKEHYNDIKDKTEMDTEIKTEFYNKLNDSISENSNFVSLYNKAINTCNFYVNSTNKNSTGCIAISESYPLSILNDYYAERDAVLSLYYEASSFYTTNDRFGSKLTYIGEDGIYSGQISADKLIGWNIEGLNIGSAVQVDLPKYVKWQKYKKNATNEKEAFEDNEGGFGPAWQINRSGNGHLANGQIYWTNNNVILGENVKLTWAQVSDGESNVNDLIDNKIENVNQRIEDIKDILNNAGIGGSGSGDGSGVPDIGELQKKLETLEGNVTYIRNNAIYSDDIIAQRLTGQTISGVNLYAGVSNNDDYNSAFGINKDGNGWLASGAFKWYKDENTGEWKVELGTGVSISWNNIIDKPTINEDGSIDGIDEKVRSTYIGQYTIGSGTIAANLVQSANNNSELIEGTEHYAVNEETGEMLDVSNELKGPSWQIANDGRGYLANGNIRWNNEGQLTINGSVIADSIKNANDEDKNKIADTLTIKELFTRGKENNTNSVNIKDNYIRIVNKDDGTYTLRLSDDSIVSNDLNAFVNNWNIDTAKTESLNLSSVNNKYTNSFSAINAGEINLGFLPKNTELFTQIAIKLNSTSNQGSALFTNSWDLLFDNGIVDPNGDITRGLFAKIYKVENNSEKFVEAVKLTLMCESVSDENPFTCSIETNKIYKIYKLTKNETGSMENYVIEKPGIYKIKIFINKNTISSNTKPYGFVSVINNLVYLDKTEDSNYTEIGKNGLISYSNNTVFMKTDNGIQMICKEGGSTISNNFYGFKVTTDGLYYCNGGTEWKKFDS